MRDKISGFKLFTFAATHFAASLLISSSELLAESTTDTPPTVSPWTISGGLQLRSAVANPKEADYTLLSRAQLTASYAATESDQIAISLAGSKQLSRDQLWVFNEASIAYGRLTQITRDWSLASGVSFDLPVNKESLRYDDARGTLGANGTISYNWQASEHSLTVSAGLALARYLYAYTHSVGGDPLVRNALTQSYSASYSLRKIWSLGVSFSDSGSQDFDGNDFDNTYSHAETIGYSYSDKLSFVLGHTNNGNTLDYGGAANNVKVYDTYTSQVFLGVTYVIY